MLTTVVRPGYRALALGVFMLLGACSATPVLHEFPQPFAADARAPSAVAYSLRETEAGSGDWVLRGGQGGTVGGFRHRLADEPGSDSRFQDGVGHGDYFFRVNARGAESTISTSWGTAAPRVTIFFAATGERVGELELRTGFDHRFEGIWRGRAILWRATLLPELVVPRETGGGNVEDHYPAAQLLEWTGGSNAGLRVYSGRAVADEPPRFAEPVYDLAAGRPLTRRELGDAVVLLFAIRALEQAAGVAAGS